MFPNQIASAMTGLPTGKPKVTHRSRKPSGKPGASHLALLQKAHGSGDLKAAKTHALNYAKAVHSGMSVTEPDADEMGGPPDMDADNAAPMAAPMAAPKPASPPGMSMARMAFAKRVKK